MSLFSMMRSRQTPERHCYKNCFPPPPRPAADQNRKQQKIARLNVGPSSLIYCEYSEVSQIPLSCRSSSTPVQKARSIILKNRPSTRPPAHPTVAAHRHRILRSGYLSAHGRKQILQGTGGQSCSDTCIYIQHEELQLSWPY